MLQTDWGTIDIVRSSGSNWATAPALDQIELTLFGPGFGECAVVHVGGNHWMILDSCWSSNKTPVALNYLTRSGLDPASCVDLIVATHWHDDHIRGLAAVLRACPNAVFSCSAALSTQEFASMVLAFDRQRMARAGSGVREINSVFSLLQDRPAQPPRHASASKTLLQIDAGAAGHNRSIRSTALSPSDHEYMLAVAALGKLMPKVGQTQYRCPPQEPNLMSVAIHVEIGETSILLGADLEQHSDNRRG